MLDPFWRDVYVRIQGRVSYGTGVQERGVDLLVAPVVGLTRSVGYTPSIFPRPGKELERLLGKAKRIRAGAPTLSAGQLAEKITDVAGARVLVIGASHVTMAHEYLCTFLQGYCRIVESPDICLETPKPGGWRGLKQVLDIPMPDGTMFPFELQVMTHLQHTWDQLQHKLYERTRQGETISPELSETFVSLSDDLYATDRKIDDLRIHIALKDG